MSSEAETFRSEALRPSNRIESLASPPAAAALQPRLRSASLGMANALFAALDVYYDDLPRIAAMNMAIDEVLLESVTIPTIRFYRWDHPALSFGYFGRYADVAQHKRDVVRRWTGGGIVFHGEDLTYSIIIPASDAAFGESSMSIYQNVHHALCDALRVMGEYAVVAAIGDRRGFWGAHAPSRTAIGALADRHGRNAEDFGEAPKSAREGACAPQICFANPVHADVMINGRKVAGAAQRRTLRGLLQQGSIQNVDVGNDLAERFAEALSNNIDNRAIEERLVRRAEEIAEQKYATDAWLRKR